jgi:dihydrofolate reductase
LADELLEAAPAFGPDQEICRVAKLFFGMNQSLDGIVDHTAFAPGPALFRHFIEQTQGLAGSIYGRGLYEVMRYWDHDDAGWDPAEREFAKAWRRSHKWVVSRSLTSVGPNATLVRGDLESTVRGLKADIAGEIEVGGPVLAQSLTALGLIDEYRNYLHPVVVGGGARYFGESRPRLRLTGHDALAEDVIRLTYAPA